MATKPFQFKKLEGMPVSWEQRQSKRRSNRGDAIHNLHRFKKYFKIIVPYGAHVKQRADPPTDIVIKAPNGWSFINVTAQQVKYPVLHANFEGHYVSVWERINFNLRKKKFFLVKTNETLR